jgi:FixJ family two-component response regulator
MLARGIEAAGFEVAFFPSAEEFLVSGGAIQTACLILDVDLPGMNGIELQKLLNESGVEIPIVFISGHADEQTGNRALEAGAIGFFNKPFSIEALVATIQSVQEQLNPI